MRKRCHKASCCCTKGFGMDSMVSAGHTSTTAVPLHTTKPRLRDSSVSLNGSSWSIRLVRVKKMEDFKGLYLGCTLLSHPVRCSEADRNPSVSQMLSDLGGCRWSSMNHKYAYLHTFSSALKLNPHSFI